LWLYRTYLNDWFFSTWYVEMPGWTCLLICVFELVLVAYFIWGIVEKLSRLKSPGDVVNAIEDWFTNGDELGDMPQTNTPYFFAGIEKSLELKRSISKEYLPMIAFRHGYAFEMGEKTFKLTTLTLNNDPTTALGKHLKPLLNGEEQITLCCDSIDRELGWPQGATKSFLLSRPLNNVNFAIEIEDIGGDKIRILRKQRMVFSLPPLWPRTKRKTHSER